MNLLTAIRALFARKESSSYAQLKASCKSHKTQEGKQVVVKIYLYKNVPQF